MPSPGRKIVTIALVDVRNPVNRPTDAARRGGLTETHPTEEGERRHLPSLTLLADNMWSRHGEWGVTFQRAVLKIGVKVNPL